MRIGVDLGGSKIEAIALAPSGEIVVRRRVATPQGCEAIVGAIRQLVLAVEGEVGEVCSVGIGTPGSLSPETGLLRNSNTTCLNGKALDRLLERALGREIRMANDADCFALSEARDGAAAGAAVVFGVIVGTGTGGGVVVDGRIRRGPNAVGGEWGHNPLPWSEPGEVQRDCYCGKKGCIETFLSGAGLVAAYRQLGGEALPAKAIAARMPTDAKAMAALRSYLRCLCRALASVIHVLDPDVIVLGGGLSNIGWLYQELPAALKPWIFGDCLRTPIRKNQHGDSGGVRGAAWLWPATGSTAQGKG